jgi:23S rRNA (uracil1939-C5)-methyltransferase
VRIEAGSILLLHIEKPVAGGRMLARHDGQVVLVSGAIPGERVRARVERAGRGVLYAGTEEVLDASPDRRDGGPDWRCGGNVYAHIAYERQIRLKGEIIRETLGRIGRLLLSEPPALVGSPERGYRMRARLHAQDGRLAFFREGTHQLCDPATTGQLLPETLAWIADAERFLRDGKLSGLAGVELTENVPGNERACCLDLEPGTDAALFAPLLGSDAVSDVLRVREDESAPAVRLRHGARSFFQSNRFLLEELVWQVAALVPGGPVVDLYAGVGLFGLSLAASGVDEVTLVEGDPASADDLMINAEPFASRVRVERSSVESFLVSDTGLIRRDGPARATFIVDPPRTGISKEAMAGIIHARPGRIVYVSCDVATLARDTRMLLDAGYQPGPMAGMDLFPNTMHIETIAAFSR